MSFDHSTTLIIQKSEILPVYELDVRFHIKVPKSNYSHVLLTIQNTDQQELLFIDNKQFIGFLYKQN